MQIKLIFVDSKEQTRKGFVRGTLALLMLLVALLLYMFLLEGAVQWLLWGVILLLVASALSVGHPTRTNEAITYGGLVGLVIFGCAFLMLATQGAFRGTIVKIAYWTFMCAFTAFVLFLIK